MMWRRPCSALRSACASPTGARRSTAIAITCAPSNAIYRAARCGRRSRAAACARAFSTSASRPGFPFVLAGSLRDDGPLPETITDMKRGPGRLRCRTERRGPGAVAWAACCTPSPPETCCHSWVRVVCVISTRRSPQGERPRHGSGRGVVADVGLFSGSACQSL